MAQDVPGGAGRGTGRGVGGGTGRAGAVTVTVEEQHVCAVLDDGKANVLGRAVLAQLRGAVATAVDAGLPLVVAGRPGFFSAGFDLGVVSSGNRRALRAMVHEAEELYRDVLRAPVPVVAACTGHALGAGALLLLCCDHRVGPVGPCRIGLPEVGIGMALPAFAHVLVRDRVPVSMITRATLYGWVPDPEGARQQGYLDQLEADPVTTATELATDLWALPSRPLALTKRLLRERVLADLEGLTLDQTEVPASWA